jgi:PhnB protein
MKTLTPYLTFPGACREAVTFYHRCVGGELAITPMSEAPVGDKAPPEAANLVMHARITKTAPILMASDNIGGRPVQPGSNCSISIDCESAEEIDSLFAALSEDGKVTMPLADAFRGARFGVLIDPFGIQWMLNFEKPR